MAKRKGKKSASKNLIIGLTCVALAIFIAIICVRWLRYRDSKFTRYPEFGISLPDNYMIHGIDVSRYQKKIDWDEVKQMNIRGVTINFAFIKATEGIESRDPNFKQNWQNAKDAGVIRGAYHYFKPDKSPVKQALHFINTVKLKSGDLPPVLDIEERGSLPADTLHARLKVFLQMLEQYYVVKPIIYSYLHFYENNLGKTFNDYPLWIAHYYEQKKPRIGRQWLFWQHNDGANVNGIASKVDFNVFNGDSAEFEALKIP